MSACQRTGIDPSCWAFRFCSNRFVDKSEPRKNWPNLHGCSHMLDPGPTRFSSNNTIRMWISTIAASAFEIIFFLWENRVFHAEQVGVTGNMWLQGWVITWIVQKEIEEFPWSMRVSYWTKTNIGLWPNEWTVWLDLNFLWLQHSSYQKNGCLSQCPSTIMWWSQVDLGQHPDFKSDDCLNTKLSLCLLQNKITEENFDFFRSHVLLIMWQDSSHAFNYRDISVIHSIQWKVTVVGGNFESDSCF